MPAAARPIIHPRKRQETPLIAPDPQFSCSIDELCSRKGMVAKI